MVIPDCGTNFGRLDFRCPSRWRLMVPCRRHKHCCSPIRDHWSSDWAMIFFRQLTDRPGVYLMHDAAGLVLYVGKAKNLRKRLGSYRVANPDRLGRRHLRLLSQVARIELQECLDESAALAKEAELLLALKPKFNRAGVWAGDTAFSHLAPDRPNAGIGHHRNTHHWLVGIWPLWQRDRIFARRSRAPALVCVKSDSGIHCQPF